MSSRKTSPDTSSSSGVSFAAGSGSSGQVKSVNISLSDNATRLSKAATAFNGHAVEIWADNAVWDTVSNKYLYPGVDYNPGDLQRT